MTSARLIGSGRVRFPALTILTTLLVVGALWLGAATSASARRQSALEEAAAAEQALAKAVYNAQGGDHSNPGACLDKAAVRRLQQLRETKADLTAALEPAIKARTRLVERLPTGDGPRSLSDRDTQRYVARALGSLNGVIEHAQKVLDAVKKERDALSLLPPCGRENEYPPPRPWPGPFDLDDTAKPGLPPVKPLPPCRNAQAEAEIAATKAMIATLEGDLEKEADNYVADRARRIVLVNSKDTTQSQLERFDRTLAKTMQRMRNTDAALKAAEARLEALLKLPACGATASPLRPETAPEHSCRPGRAASNLEQGVLRKINDARTDPVEYAGRIRINTRDAEEATSFLMIQTALERITFDPRLMAAAERQVADMTATGKVSHIGSDGSGPLKRVQQTGLWSMTVAEEISLGQSQASGVVDGLIIDAGSPGRPHRADIFSPGLLFGGVACGPFPKFGAICVIVFSGPIIRETDGEAPWAPCEETRLRGDR